MNVKVTGNRSPGNKVTVALEMEEWEADEIMEMLEAQLQRAAASGKDVADALDNESALAMFLALRFRPRPAPRPRPEPASRERVGSLAKKVQPKITGGKGY